jgi:hypothetical protein
MLNHSGLIVSNVKRRMDKSKRLRYSVTDPKAQRGVEV